MDQLIADLERERERLAGVVELYAIRSEFNEQWEGPLEAALQSFRDCEVQLDNLIVEQDAKAYELANREAWFEAEADDYGLG